MKMAAPSQATSWRANLVFVLCLLAFSIGGCTSEPPVAVSFRALGARNMVVHDGKLVELNLAQAVISDSDLAKLSEAPELTSLDLGLCTKLTDASLDHVAKLTELESLTINSNPNITDAGIAKLSPLKKVKFLDIGQSKLTNESLATVGQLPALEKLNIAFVAGIDDAGVEKLDELKNLNEIWLPSTGVTSAGVAHLVTAHPGINVHGADEEEETESSSAELPADSQ